MNDYKTRDEIDFELSRAYFGNTETVKIPESCEKAPQENTLQKNQQKNARQKTGQNAPHSPRRPWSSLRILFIIWVLSCIVFAAGYFIREKRIVFSVNINVEPRATSVEQASTPKTLPVVTSLPNPESISGEIPMQPGLPAVTSPVRHRLNPEETLIKPEINIGTIVPQDVKTLYGFEEDEQAWEIPAWAWDKPDHVARSLKKTNLIASEGAGSLELNAEFPGDGWTAALIEIQQYLDLGNYDTLQADIYVPASGPTGLRGKLILTVGEEWKFIETSRTTRLAPGKWTTITASLKEGSTDWRRTIVDEAFKSDVRKIAIRVESNKKPAYSGPIYIDNIRVSK